MQQSSIATSTKMVKPKSKSKMKKTNLMIIMPFLIFGLGALFYCYEYYLRIAPSVMTYEIMKSFNVDAALLGNLTAFYYYAYAPMQIPVGYLMDRYGPRRLLTMACFACALGTYIFASTSNLQIASIGRFLMGFGSAFAFVGVLKLATIWLPEERFALFSGLASALGTIGAMSGDIWLSRLVQQVGWRETLTLAATVGVILSLAIFFWIRDHNTIDPHRKFEVHPSSTRLLKAIGKILSNPQMWIIGLIGCLMYLPTSTFAELWAIPYLRNAYLYSDQHASDTISLIFLGFTIGAPLAGFISDKLHRRKIPLLVGCIAAGIIMSIIVYVPNLSDRTLTILMFLLGMSYAAQAIVFAVGRELCPPEFSGTAVAITNMFVMLGGALFEPVVGILIEAGWKGLIESGIHIYTVSDYQKALSVIPIGLGIAFILILFLKETGKKIKHSKS